MDEVKMELWEFQARQSLIKRMVAAAMREFCRAPDGDAVWEGMKQRLEEAFEGREVQSFLIRDGVRGMLDCVELTLIERKRLPEDTTHSTMMFSFPVYRRWVDHAQAAQDDGLLSVISQAVMPQPR